MVTDHHAMEGHDDAAGTIEEGPLNDLAFRQCRGKRRRRRQSAKVFLVFFDFRLSDYCATMGSLLYLAPSQSEGHNTKECGSRGVDSFPQVVELLRKTEAANEVPPLESTPTPDLANSFG